MDIYTLLGYFAQNYNVSLTEEFKNPLTKKAWLKAFGDLSLDELELVLMNAIAVFPKNKFPSPGQIYDAYFKPRLEIKAIEEWQKVMEACQKDYWDGIVFLHQLSDAGQLALKSVDGLKALKEKADSFVKQKFISNWVNYHEQLRNGIVQPLPKVLAPSQTKPVLYEPLTPEEREEHIKQMNEIRQRLSQGLSYNF
jgi:hypothetical protein